MVGAGDPVFIYRAVVTQLHVIVASWIVDSMWLELLIFQDKSEFLCEIS